MSDTFSVRAGLAFCFLLASGIAGADTLGPDSFGYTADTDAPFDYQDISGTGTQILDDVDDDFELIPIGFTFPFYGTSRTEVYVSSNALLTFGEGNDEYDNEDLNDNNEPDQPVIAVLWSDWYTEDLADAVYYETRSNPERLIVQWHMVTPCCGDYGFADFQAVLFENGDIEFHYLDVDGLDYNNNGDDSTVGIRNLNDSGQATANGHVLQVSYDEPSINNSQAIHFSYPSVDDFDEASFIADDDEPAPSTSSGAVTLPGLVLLALAGLARRRSRRLSV